MIENQVAGRMSAADARDCDNTDVETVCGGLDDRAPAYG